MGQTSITSALSSVSSLTNVASATMQKVKMVSEIKDGRLFVKPFKVEFGDYETEVFGSTGIDGSLDYTLALDVPATAVGNQLSGLLSSVSNNSIKVNTDMILDLGLKGTYLKPKVVLSGIRSANGQNFNDAVTASIEAKIEEEKKVIEEKVTAEIEQAKDSVTQIAEAEIAVIKDTVNTIIDSQVDSASSELTKKLGIPSDSLTTEEKLVKEKAESIIKGLFKKKKKKNGTDGN